jgi:hypothetical protein
VDANPTAEDSGLKAIRAYRVSKIGLGDAILPQFPCNFIKTGIFPLLSGRRLVV